ncbi:MAG TPA: ATP-binding cassette domain-containing protein [Gemmatimonadaceae bacterium]
MAELRGVHVRAGDAIILDDISTRFRPNRFNVILGPNGAGKSTLLKVATGLLRPSAGEVRYADLPIAALDAGTLARTRAVLSQHVELAFPLAVEDVVLMGRYPHYGRVPTARDRDIVDRALDLVGMTPKRKQLYPTLSGGEQQKVQLARVLAQIWNYDTPNEHKYLFLDEPTSSLDVHYQLHLLDIARGLLDYNCTVVAILHDLNVSFQYGDAFFLMEGGRLVHESDCADEIPQAMLERVFAVRARRVTDPVSREGFWRFEL